jgi:uncharacterized protein with FMN-binding domain
MRRIVMAIAATVSIVVLLFSYRTSTDQATVPVAADQSRTSRSSASTTPTTTHAASGTSGTFTGSAADTQYGPVQVRIAVSGGKITSAQTVQVPQESDRDVEINTSAVPVLNQEAVQKQTAQIDSVSGATYTSEGYAQSLQSAIDAAHR